MFSSISGPGWFHGLDYTFELIAALITIIISYYSFRIFWLSREKKYIYLTLAFGSVSIAYLIRAGLDWLIYKNYLPNIPNLSAAVETVMETSAIHSAALIAYSFLMLAGFLVLTAVFLRLQGRLMQLLLVGILAVLLGLTLFSRQIFLTSGIIMLVMLAFIIFHQYKCYAKKRLTSQLFVLLGMSILLLSQIGFILTLITHYSELFYILGHSLQLLGYILLLANMVLVFKK
jgi:hypothetical protein